jgi:hypothetical protein
MKLTPEQIQGVLELEPNAQIDRLQSAKPYIRTGYWNRNRDLESLNAGLAKLGLKAEEYDDYDEDTGWLYWYVLEPISNELSPEDQATVDKYEEEEANREVPRDYASMYERFQKLAGINEEYSSTDFDTYKIGDQIELNPKYFTAFEMPDGYVGTVTNINQADYADETPVYTVKLKNIDPFGDEHEDISVEYKQVK